VFTDHALYQAEEELTLAFYNCHIEAHSNQECVVLPFLLKVNVQPHLSLHTITSRRILAYLIPLRILKGHLPSAELMKRFPVLDEIFAPFIAAIRTGDLKSFDQALDKWETRLLELNLWFSLEKARELCIRGLFRKMYAPLACILSIFRPLISLLLFLFLHRWVATGKGTRIPISMFHTALTVSGIDVVEDEAECLVANMIYKNFIRGYISHEKQMVVLAAANTFPRVADRPSPLAMI
jgi:hypothetical protein